MVATGCLLHPSLDSYDQSTNRAQLVKNNERACQLLQVHVVDDYMRQCWKAQVRIYHRYMCACVHGHVWLKHAGQVNILPSRPGPLRVRSSRRESAVF